MQGILIIFFVVVGVPLNLMCRSGGVSQIDRIGSPLLFEIHLWNHKFCCAFLHGEVLRAALQPRIMFLNRKRWLLHPFSGVLCLLKKM